MITSTIQPMSKDVDDAVTGIIVAANSLESNETFLGVSILDRYPNALWDNPRRLFSVTALVERDLGNDATSVVLRKIGLYALTIEEVDNLKRLAWDMVASFEGDVWPMTGGVIPTWLACNTQLLPAEWTTAVANYVAHPDEASYDQMCKVQEYTYACQLYVRKDRWDDRREALRDIGTEYKYVGV